MTKSTKMWSLINVYYKHGHADHYSFLTENELREFLLNKLDEVIEEYNYGHSDHKEIELFFSH